MPNLFWKNDQGAVISLKETTFRTEEELEDLIHKHSDLLGDLFIISRQTRTSTRQSIPDLVAIDTNNNAVIIELKRDVATEDVIPQVLRYAIWAETNPDAIKALWLESDRKPDDMKIDWNSLDVKIMIIAPSVTAGLQRMINRITYEVELLEIARFAHDQQEFLLLSTRQPESFPSIGVSKGKPIYNEDHYRRHYDSKNVGVFLHTVDRVRKLVKDKNWNLEVRYQERWISFRHGRRIAFLVEWRGKKDFYMIFKVPRKVAESIQIQGLDSHSYEDKYKQILYRVTGRNYPLERLMPLFEAAYQNISGNTL